MTQSSICRRLINKVWRSYVDDLDKVPEAKGIYVIGDKDKETVLYVGHSKQMQQRLHQHKSGPQAIDEFVKRQFASANGGKKLGIKWVEDPNHKCVEGEYLDCIEKMLGYRPRFNKKDGNRCN